MLHIYIPLSCFCTSRIAFYLSVASEILVMCNALIPGTFNFKNVAYADVYVSIICIFQMFSSSDLHQVTL